MLSTTCDLPALDSLEFTNDLHVMHPLLLLLVLLAVAPLDAMLPAPALT